MRQGMKKLSSIERAVIGIGEGYRAAGARSPRESEIVREFMKGLRRLLRNEKRRQAAPLLPDDVKKLVDGLDDSSRGLRNRALVLVGFYGALRRSELVALDRDDVCDEPSGLLVRIRHSKTDQEGQGTCIGLPRARDVRYCPAAAVTAWNTSHAGEKLCWFKRFDGSASSGFLRRPRLPERAGDAAGQHVRAEVVGVSKSF